MLEFELNHVTNRGFRSYSVCRPIEGYVICSVVFCKIVDNISRNDSASQSVILDKILRLYRQQGGIDFKSDPCHISFLRCALGYLHNS